MDIGKTRKRKQPERYGKLVLDFTSKSDEFEPFTDNSFDDKTYEPEKSNDVNLHQTGGTDDGLSMNSAGENIDSGHRIQSNNHGFHDNSINFDAEFDAITSAKRVTEFDQTDSANKDSPNRVFASQKLTLHEFPSQDGFQTKVLHQLQQILTRIGVIEDSLIRNGGLISVKIENDKQAPFKEWTSFAKTKELPFKTVDAFIAFEDTLDEKSMKEAVNALSKIPGINSNDMMGNKTKKLKTVLHSIIERSCFANFTWTGKSVNGQTKHAMNKLPKILQLLHTVVKGQDESFTYDLFLHQLKEKVIKYAYEHAGKPRHSRVNTGGSSKTIANETGATSEKEVLVCTSSFAEPSEEIISAKTKAIAQRTCYNLNGRTQAPKQNASTPLHKSKHIDHGGLQSNFDAMYGAINLEEASLPKESNVQNHSIAEVRRDTKSLLDGIFNNPRKVPKSKYWPDSWEMLRNDHCAASESSDRITSMMYPYRDHEQVAKRQKAGQSDIDVPISSYSRSQLQPRGKYMANLARSHNPYFDV